MIAANERPQGHPSLGLVYIAAYLRKYLRDVNITVWEYIPTNISKIIRLSPDIIGVSAMTVQYEKAKEFCKRIKEKMDIPVVVGGHHVSFLPEKLDDCFDIGIIGEGEQTMLELIKLFLRGYWKKCYLHTIDGIVFKENTELFITKSRRFIEPLDEIPYPARDLLDMEYHFKFENVIGNRFGRGTHLFTSRGCPYKCIFCSAKSFWKNIRFHSPEYILGEINHLINEYKVELLNLYDDLFTLNKNRLKRIAELINKEKINRKVEFQVQGRIDTFDDEIARELKKMNVTWISFGFESATPRIVSFLKNKKLTIGQTKKAVEIAKRYGLFVQGTFIIGTPGETEEEMLKTLEFIKDLRLDKFAHYPLIPFPGTKLWEMLKKKKLVSNEMNWNIFDMKKPGGVLTVGDVKNNKNQIYINQKVNPEKFVEIYQRFEKERTRLFNYRWDLVSQIHRIKNDKI